jgi:hypothetical protein
VVYAPAEAIPRHGNSHAHWKAALGFGDHPL